MSNDPIYLVQVGTGDTIHAYWNVGMLLLDIRLNRQESVRIFKRSNEAGYLRYREITLAELRSAA